MERSKLTQLFEAFKTFQNFGIDMSTLIDGHISTQKTADLEGQCNKVDKIPKPSRHQQPIDTITNDRNNGNQVNQVAEGHEPRAEDKHNIVEMVNDEVNDNKEGVHKNPVEVYNSPAVKSFHDALTGLKEVVGEVREFNPMKPLSMPTSKDGNLVVDLDEEEYKK